MLGVQASNFGFESAVRCTTKKGQYFINEHIHQFSEIVLVREGEIEVTVDGRTETARKGDIIFITPFHSHSFSTPVYSELWLAVFSNDFISDFAGTKDIYRTAERSVFTPSDVLLNFLSDKLIDSSERFIIYDAATYRSIRAAIYAVFEEYTRTVPSIDSPVHSKSSVVLSVFEYLGTHFKENVSLNSTAKALGYNPEYVSHCLSKIRGMNFRYILNSFRVDCAKNMLLSTKKSIQEIAIESGFSGERSFHRVFVKMIGNSPGEYRRRTFSPPYTTSDGESGAVGMGLRPKTSSIKKI